VASTVSAGKQKEVISKMVREVLQEKGLLNRPSEKPALTRVQRDRATPAVLNVFHPGVRKLEGALEQIRLIEGIAGRSGTFTVNSARSWVCGDDVREKTGSKCILDTVKPQGLEKALQKADILVLPTFCFKTAAKVSCLFGDDQESTIVLSALFQNKPVLATNDGFTLLNTLSNKGIRDEIERLLGKLESFGMTFCKTQQLATTFQKMVTRGNPSPSSEIKKEPGHQTAPARNLITAKDVRLAAGKNQDTIILASGGLVTPLAKDQARENGIRIIQAGP
jgi:ethanolamine utilization protein